VREALINSARHAKATQAYATISIAMDCIKIDISDDGCGFPFQGHYNLPGLIALRLGPRSLMERIIALQGKLTINSSAAGARLEMSIPLQPCKRAVGMPSNASLQIQLEKTP